MPLKVHDLEIDIGQRRVSRAGQPITLTPQEYRLLELLARHRGRPVGSVLIWQHFHGDLDGYRPRRVCCCVRALRDKIDKGFAPALIVTRRASGYLLRDDAALQPAVRPHSPEPGLNRRQRELIGRALRNPSEVFTFHQHQTAHHVSRVTARSDVLGLLESGLLAEVQGGRRRAFLAAPDLAERLAPAGKRQPGKEG
jgi:DNA-binding winged helix-turn-helix (wHTH) protein